MPERLDAILLGVGVLAVALAVVLFVVLPETQVPQRQFVATFTETSAEAPPQQATATEGQAVELAFPVAEGNLSRILVTVRFADDNAASDPDTLRIEVVGPDGATYGAPVETANPLPVPDGGTPPGYTPVPGVIVLAVPVHEKPSTQVIAAASRGETPEEAASRVAEVLSADGAGTWTVRIGVRAGDCPAVELDPQRAGACQAAQPGGADGGNAVEVVQFQTFHWSASLAPDAA